MELDKIVDPILLFKQWLSEAEKKEIRDPNAMQLATVSKNGMPSVRTVLLKDIINSDFVFYTNYESEKGKAIKSNPNVCLSFFWHSAERQVIIKGKAEKISGNLSDGYFETRPRGSQLGAIVSNQSEPIANRNILDEKLKILEKKYEGREIKRPEFWGGYIVRPIEIEFWQGRPNRLHDRIRYKFQEDYNWKIERLCP